MKSTIFFLVLLFISVTAFTPAAYFAHGGISSSSLNSVPLAGGMSFDRVCREWRCKYTGDKTDSESLAAVTGVVDKHLATIKGLSSGVTVNRLVCGQCLDFKLQITMPLDDYGPWSEKDHSPESDFLAALKGIDGVSQVETQTITNMII